MSDTGMQTFSGPPPADQGAKRDVASDGILYTYRRSPGSGTAYVSASLIADNTGNAPAISAYMFADDDRCAALTADEFVTMLRARLTADEFVTMLRARFSDLVAVLG